MCLGIPMQVLGFEGDYALCATGFEQRLINTQLITQPEVGAWLLVFLDTAREIISEQQALIINNALHALTLTLQGETNIDHLFADLVNREAQLPDFLETAK